MVSETHDAEEDGKNGESHQLNRLATNGIHQSDGDPVTWNGASADNNQVANCGVVENFVDVSKRG